METLQELIKIGGLPFALVVLALSAGQRGWWVWRREVLREREVAEEAVRREVERRREWEKRASYWEQFALRAIGGMERGVVANERAADAVREVARMVAPDAGA